MTNLPPHAGSAKPGNFYFVVNAMIPTTRQLELLRTLARDDTLFLRVDDFIRGYRTTPDWHIIDASGDRVRKVHARLVKNLVKNGWLSCVGLPGCLILSIAGREQVRLAKERKESRYAKITDRRQARFI